jgi:formimidoylglutamate deiminase
MAQKPNRDQRPPQRSDDRTARDPRAGGGGGGYGGGHGGSRPAPVPTANVKSGVPHGATESGWLPDCVYTGEKFETGLAFFADAVGRITRFSREPADLAAARRLEGQAALPGLVNTHSHAFQRVLRGRGDARNREAHERAIGRLNEEDVFDTARMVFMEMLLSGITCVGEFHYLHQNADGTPLADPNQLAREIIRGAHDVGIRISLLKVAYARGDYRGAAAAAPGRFRTAAADQFVRETETLRVAMEKEFPADEAWLGVGAHSVAKVPAEYFKTIATYARTHRMRVHAHLSTRAEENTACIAEYGRTPVAVLAEHGLLDKRFTAIDAIHLSDDDVKVLGTARATVCACPISEHMLGLGAAPIEKLVAAGAGIALGSDGHGQIDLLKEARLLEFHLRNTRQQRAVFGTAPATALFHAATVTGARSLGATSGALEVGRPADFFTVNLYDPSIAGADPEVLLANIVFALERRAIRDVWVGARQRVANGRHAFHGPIVGRFVDVQRRIWAA